MKKKNSQLILLSLILLIFSSAHAGGNSSWGSASVLNTKYEPRKVVYDLVTGEEKYLGEILDRIGYLFKLYESDIFDSSIVVVIHGDAIPFFAINEMKKYESVMKRAQSLTVGTTIEFRMCRAAAKLMDYEPKDIHGFVKMVPMADAEIVRLQAEDYEYMQ